MHRFLTFLILLIIIDSACTQRQPSEKYLSESTMQDSTLASDNPILNEPESTEEKSDLTTDSINSELEDCRKNINDSIGSYYTVTISTSQYEASSSVTWHFDKNVSPRYFKDDWAMEGTEGSTEFFIDNNTMKCAFESESFGTGSTATSWCKETGGLRLTHEDESGNDTTETLPAHYNHQLEESFNRYFSVLKTLLKEGKVEDETVDPYTIKIENKPYEGDEFTEITEISIPRELYKALN